MIVSPGLHRAAPLGVLDQRQRRAVLDRAGRVVALELGQDPDVRVGRDVLQLDERRLADRRDQVRRDRRGRRRQADVGHPRRRPAIAGRIRSVSPSDTSVSSHDSSRTSSSLR